MSQNAVSQEEIALMAHLLRRAGFGASRDEIEARAQQGYDSVVEELLNPADDPGIDEDLMYRAYPSYFDKAAIETGQTEIVYRMINNKHQLKEKMALFWHTILCAGDNKVDNARTTSMQYDTFREKGMGNFKELLLWLSTDPAMLYYLDNIESHKTAVNENYGRELLELFSLGVGMDQEFNYTEDDVKACARAFTGWNLAPTIPVFPYGRTPFEFRFDPADHDYGEKTFLGETGNWNGDEVVDIICKQPAAARFVARKLYDFFVADEPPVPAWRLSEPRDIEAIKQLEQAYFDSGYEIKAMLEVLFKSDFFKAEGVRYAKVKSPGRRGHRHHAHGAGPHRAQARPVLRGDGAEVHGHGPAEPAHRRRLAHGPRVDQQRQPDRPHQLRLQGAGRHQPAGHPVHGQPADGPGREPERRADG